MTSTSDKFTNYYTLLGIDPKSDRQTVKQAYLAKIKEWHPDKNPDNSEKSKAKFQEISEAYGVLSDPVKKHQYDANARYGIIFSGIVFERSNSGFSGFRNTEFNEVIDFYINVFKNVKFY